MELPQSSETWTSIENYVRKTPGPPVFFFVCCGPRVERVFKVMSFECYRYTKPHNNYPPILQKCKGVQLNKQLKINSHAKVYFSQWR